MCSFKLFLIIALFKVFCLARAEVPCQLQNETCIFTEVKTTKDSSYFMPKVPTDTVVKRISFKNSQLQGFTPEICQKFTALEELELSHLGIEDFFNTPFNSCRNLKKLRITDNLPITSIPTTAFITGNNLEELTFKIFNFKDHKVNYAFFNNLQKLTKLELDTCDLSEFDINRMPVLGNLRELNLANNQITNISVSQLSGKFPNLQKLILCDNPIEYDTAMKLKHNRIKIITNCHNKYFNLRNIIIGSSILVFLILSHVIVGILCNRRLRKSIKQKLSCC